MMDEVSWENKYCLWNVSVDLFAYSHKAVYFLVCLIRKLYKPYLELCWGSAAGQAVKTPVRTESTENKVEFQTLVLCKQYKNKGTPGLFMAPAPPKAKPEPGAAPHPGVTLLHAVLLLREWCRGVTFLAEPCCSACPVVPWHKAAAPLTWQSLHPAVLLLCLAVHLGRCWGEAGKACVAQVLGRQDRNRRRVRNKSLLGQRNSVYCLGRGDTSDCLANVIQLSPGLAMQLKARLWQEDDEERRKCPEEWDLIKKKKKNRYCPAVSQVLSF